MKVRSLLLAAAIVLLTILPFWWSGAPDGGAARFGGADERGQAAIGAIAPAYRPWFEPVFTPPSGEIASLLFALQAAAGAGVLGLVLGYWLGRATARNRRAD